MIGREVSILILAVAFAGLLGCGGNTDIAATFDLAAMQEMIEETNVRFAQAHITGDTAFLNNIVTRDARIYPPNSDVVTGYAAIAEVNAQWVDFGITEFREETTRFYGNEDYLIDEGTYVLVYGEENVTDRGKYLNVWKKEDGEWKMFSNIWNTSLPATPAE